jgi:AGCS family alanine or glycine:cation symporter
MKRALFSNEAGQGSSPIAHSAAKTDEPVREGVVAGLEPFIDTIVVCTMTTLVILLTGMWNRAPDLEFATTPAVVQASETNWSLEPTPITAHKSQMDDLFEGADVFCIVQADTTNPDNVNRNTGKFLYKLPGTIHVEEAAGAETYTVNWKDMAESPSQKRGQIFGGISLVPNEETGLPGAYFEYKGATLTAKAFDSVSPGLGKWLVVLASWLFAVSTMISWSYYGEQGIVFLFGRKLVLSYKFAYCLLIIVATVPALIKTDGQLDRLTALGTGVMLWANIPIMLIFGPIAMKAYHNYFKRMDAGEDPPHKAPPFEDVVEGKDVE